MFNTSGYNDVEYEEYVQPISGRYAGYVLKIRTFSDGLNLICTVQHGEDILGVFVVGNLVTHKYLTEFEFILSVRKLYDQA